MSGQPVPNDPVELTDYIQSRFHDTHRKQMTDLAELVDLLVEEQSCDPVKVTDFGGFLNSIANELLLHMRKEETILFPAMRQSDYFGLQHPIAVMRAEHDDHATSLTELRQKAEGLFSNDTCPEKTQELFAAKVNEFIGDLEAHIELENEVLFPQFMQD